MNYLIAISPIIEKLPASHRSKWEKEIVCYAEEHNYVYPTFHEFSTTIQNKARKKNHPNVSAGTLRRTLVLKIDVARITKDTFLNLETRSNKL